MTIKRKWDIQYSKNPWFSFGFHVDHTDPSITLHLPGVVIYLGRCKQPGFRAGVDQKETYAQPGHGWTCFHCGETFTTPGSARDHFGADQTAKPGCLIRVSYGGERGLLMELRKAEAIIASYVNEDIDTMKNMFSMQDRHSSALEEAETVGYERGLRDSRREPTRNNLEN